MTDLVTRGLFRSDVRRRVYALSIRRTGVLGLVLAIVVAAGCRRGESPGAAASKPPAPTAAADREEPPVIREMAESGRPPFEGLREPRDAAMDARGRVFIADFGHSRLRIFDRDGGSLGGWGGRGSGTYGFRDPSAVAVRGEDVYVADTWNGRVQHFTTAGDWKGTGAGLFGPRGVAVGPDGRVWVTDTGNHQVRVYDASLGSFQVFGKQGPGAGELSSPVGIAVGPSGRVYVADTGNRRIVVLASDGKFETAWPVTVWEQAVEPHIEVDADGSLYVTDPAGAGAVLHLDGEGHTVQTWTAGTKGEKFSLPTGLALNAAERTLCVINRGNDTVSRIALSNASNP
jgi:sugar lactone lactonase YvrE